MSEVKTEKLSPRVTSLQLGDSGDTFTVPSGAEIDIASGATLDVNGTIDLTGATKTGFPAGGLTEVDQWRLTANFLSTGADITANLERNDTTGFSLLGTGMTESSGIFSFPSTGHWLVTSTMFITSASGDHLGVEARFTVDYSTGPTWTLQGSQNIGTGITIQNSATYIVDVTDTAECKMKFTTQSVNSGSGILGSTTVNQSWWTFAKLGDT
tara:strand:- start:218 stop:853 length:636 start_codon:yes stop_codon:yes gene_type:complete